MITLTVLCLVALACGYKLPNIYEPVARSTRGLSSFAAGIGPSDATYLPPSNAYLTPNNFASANPASSYITPADTDKEFYTFTAPDAEFEDPHATDRALGAVKQALRVIFIKGPENKGLEDAALALAKQAAQQQTSIFVLNKQNDIGELANKINDASRSANIKPEVHFVKYRTAEDAFNAQRAIQSQYDSLAGKSQSINGGAARVLNFASQSAIHSPNAQIPKNAYLPTSVFRFRF